MRGRTTANAAVSWGEWPLERQPEARRSTTLTLLNDRASL